MNKRGRIAGTWHGDFVRASNLDRSGSTCPSPASELPSVCVDFASAPMRRADRTRRRPSPVRASTAGHTREKARRLVRDAAPGSPAPPQQRAGNGPALVVAFIAGGLLVLFLTSLFSSHTVTPPALPPAAVSVPQAPPLPIPVKRNRVHRSKQGTAQKVRQPSPSQASQP